MHEVGTVTIAAQIIYLCSSVVDCILVPTVVGHERGAMRVAHTPTGPALVGCRGGREREEGEEEGGEREGGGREGEGGGGRREERRRREGEGGGSETYREKVEGNVW